MHLNGIRCKLPFFLEDALGEATLPHIRGSALGRVRIWLGTRGARRRRKALEHGEL